MIRLAALFMVLCVTAMTSSLVQADETRTLVLVTGGGKSEASFTASEIRRLFLGLPVSSQRQPPLALINHTDSLLYQVFLQKVIFMSAHLYERQLLTNVVRLGGQGPRVYTDWRGLLNALHDQPGSVTYMWKEQIPAAAGLVVVSEVWQGRTD